MSLDRRRALWRAVQLVLLVVVAWGLYRTLASNLRELSWEQLTQWRPDPLLLTLSFFLLVATYIGHALLWRMIMRDLRIGSLTFRATVQVYFLAGLGRYIPGRLWALAGFALLAKRAGLPAVPAAASQVLGQMAFLSTGLLFLGLSLPDWNRTLGDAGATGFIIGTVLLIIAAGALWLLFATSVGHSFRESLIRRLGGRAGERLTAAFALAEQVTMHNALKWALGYALSWAVLGTAFALFAIAFVPDAADSTRFLAGAVAASYLGGYIAVFAPAGLMVREGAMFVLLEQVMPQPAAFVVSILSRVWFTAGELVPLALLPVLPVNAGEEAA